MPTTRRLCRETRTIVLLLEMTGWSLARGCMPRCQNCSRQAIRRYVVSYDMLIYL